MIEPVIAALELFNFKLSDRYPNVITKGIGFGNSYTRLQFIYQSGYKTIKPFNWSLRALSLIVEIHSPEYGYHKSSFDLIDQLTDKAIYSDSSTSDEAGIARRIIDERSALYNIFFCHHLHRVINNYNIIQSGPIDFEKKVELWVITKEYEKGRWGGVDKDNYYTVYLEYNYFIVIDGEIWIDDYIRKALQPNWVKILNEYRDYRPTHETASEVFRLQEGDAVILDLFKSKYDGFDHRQYLDALKKGD